MNVCRLSLILFLVCTVSLYVSPSSLWAHGSVSKRFFPEPLVMEDPFAADELDLPSIRYRRGHDERELSIGGELQKRITPTIGVAVEWEYLFLNPRDPAEPNSSGFENPEF